MSKSARPMKLLAFLFAITSHTPSAFAPSPHLDVSSSALPLLRAVRSSSYPNVAMQRRSSRPSNPTDGPAESLNASTSRTRPISNSRSDQSRPDRAPRSDQSLRRYLSNEGLNPSEFLDFPAQSSADYAGATASRQRTQPRPPLPLPDRVLVCVLPQGTQLANGLRHLSTCAILAEATGRRLLLDPTLSMSADFFRSAPAPRRPGSP